MNQFGFCAADHGLAIALDTGSFRVICRDSFESNFLATDGEVRFSFECFFFRCPFNFDDPVGFGGQCRRIGSLTINGNGAEIRGCRCSPCHGQ